MRGIPRSLVLEMFGKSCILLVQGIIAMRIEVVSFDQNETVFYGTAYTKQYYVRSRSKMRLLLVKYF